MKNKILSIIATVCVVVSIVPFGAFSFKIDAAKWGYYTYGIIDGEVTILDINDGISGDVTIPSTLGGYPVAKISDKVLADYVDVSEGGGIYSISIPESVIEIGDEAFFGRSDMWKINLPDNLKKLGIAAFKYCSSLRSIYIPGGIKHISEDAFYYCLELEEVILEEGIDRIDSYAFNECIALTEITIPSTLKFVDKYAFRSDKKLKTIYYCGTEEQWSQIEIAEGNDCFENANIIFNVCGHNWQDAEVISQGSCTIVKKILQTCTKCKESRTKSIRAQGHNYNEDAICSVCGSEHSDLSKINYDIENGEAIIDISRSLSSKDLLVPAHLDGHTVTKLGYSAFSIGDAGGGSAITAVLPDTIKEFGSRAFEGRGTLVSIKLPKYLEKIGSYAFCYGYGLSRIIIPDTVNYIGQFAFYECTALKNLKLPSGITEICNDTFNQCSSLKYVAIPDTVTSIGDRAFGYCRAMKKAFIPESVTYISKSAFPYVSDYSSERATTLIVYEDSYAHKFAVENNFKYYLIRKYHNPEIAYGTEVTGKVLNVNGKATSGITVELMYPDNVIKETVKTDYSGRYTFTYAEVGDYTIRATDTEGNAVSSKISVKRADEFDVYVSGDTNLTLKKGYSVNGTVNAPGANITITDTQGNVIAEVTADENGNFTIGNIPNGEYIIKAESENGTAVGEVTVFDGNVSDITLNIETQTPAQTVTLWGYVEVENRNGTTNRKNWVEVKLYDADGNVVVTTRSDSDGKYSFGNLPTGEYTIVTETTEMRPDKTYGYDRVHTLTGYGYVNASAAGETQVETIILYEENDAKASLSGKVTAHGETQDCKVTLTNVLGDEISSLTTNKNGKYSFSNVVDGMYYITAVTKSDGMGYTVVVVRDGEIFGDLDITVYKDDKVTRQEFAFMTDVPDCTTKEQAETYRERIAQEKRLYDALSQKEKKQLSESYIDKLNTLCELLAQCEVTAQEGVTVEQTGLVVSGDELEDKDNISFNILVEKTDAWETNIDGVKDDKDFIHHNMKDKANNKTMTQYYEISMSKTVDGEEKEITSVYKDTDSNGKFRITMDIPEEYRGYKNYSLVHVHCGETVLLTDLDDNPDTITFEVDMFSTFVLTATDETLGEAVQDDQNFKFSGASLTLTDNISVNYKVKKTVVTELGYSDLYVKFIFDGQEYIVNKYSESGEYYVFTFDNIAPNYINDIIYATLYGTKDGELCESAQTEYSVATYCYNMLNKYSSDEHAKFRTLLVDLLNFGAQSQIYSSRNTDNLANAALTSEQKAWGTSTVRTYNSVQNLTYKIIDNPTVNWKGGGLYLNDSVTMRFTIQTESIENLSVKVQKGDESYVIKSSSFKAIGDNKYHVYFDGLNATQMSETVYLTVCEGEIEVSNTISYSIESYAAAKYDANGTKLSDLVVAMMKYGDAANAYKISLEQQ